MTESAGTSYIVLVVEDDPLVRMAAVEMVLDASWQVFEAVDGDQALAILYAHPEINVLFTDVEMPGSMDGFMLATAAKKRMPGLTVIIISGRMGPSSAMPEGAKFFSKPYSTAEVMAAIQSGG